jgi:hypothetical protein
MFNATCDKSRCIKLSKACNYNMITVKVQSPSLMRLFHLPLFLFNISLPCRFYVIQGRAKVFPAIQHHTNASALEGFSNNNLINAPIAARCSLSDPELRISTRGWKACLAASPTLMWSTVKRPFKVLATLYLDPLVPKCNTATS